jgi:hypothetical protein
MTAGRERIIRILDTMHLDTVFVSEAILEEIKNKADIIRGPVNQFDSQGELCGWES